MRSLPVFLALAGRSKDDDAVQELVISTRRIHGDAVDLLKTVPLYMRQYTLHDQVHVDRVVDLMGRLLSKEVLDSLRPLELASLIWAAALHDIGMAASQDEIVKMRNEGRRRSPSKTEYQVFRETCPRILRRIDELHHEGLHSHASDMENYLTSEYLRREHGHRSKRAIFEHFKSMCVYDGANFAHRIAEVCISHVKSIEEVGRLPCWETVRAGGEGCNWRFIALMLRLADILDFDAKRTPRILFEHLGVRDKISLNEWGKHLSVNAWDISPRRIVFNAKCPDPVIEKATYDFIDAIDAELLEIPSVLARMHHSEKHDLRDLYRLDLPRRVDRSEIGPQEDINGPIYHYLDVEFRLSRDKIISLVLGVHLYAERSLFLRELLQNAVDACRHRAALHRSDAGLGPYEPEVVVRVKSTSEAIFVEVEDNGMGMDERVVQEYFAQVGRSYYSSSEFLEERAREGLEFQPISQFGIGILSTFMAGDQLSVDTLRFGQACVPLAIQIADEGSLFWFRQGSRRTPGTRVSLRLKRSMEELFPADVSPGARVNQPSTLQERMSHAVEYLAPHVDIPIRIEADGSVTSLSPRWDKSRFYSNETIAKGVDIVLGDDDAAGIRGIARVFFLCDPGTDRFRVRTEVDQDLLDEGDEDDYVEFRHEPGFIRADITTVLRSGRREHGSRPEVQSGGRWSQQGILVPAQLFPASPDWGRRQPSFVIPFPLPIHFDLDLSGRFVLPLSADRKHVLPSEEAGVVGKGIALVVVDRLFEELGHRLVRENARFFETVFSMVEGEHLVRALRRFLNRLR